jgi:GH24 family phage-related lysozyme (muramidase)
VKPVLVKPKRIPSLEEARADLFGFKSDEEEPMPDYGGGGLADKAFELIRRHEGFRSKPYLDTNKNWTVGIGTLIGKGTDADLKASPFYKREIDEATAKDLATKAISEKIVLAKKLIGPDTFEGFSPELQAQLVSGAYRGDITGSPKALKLLAQGDFAGASREFLDNEEYRKAKASKSGVAKRMEEMASVIEKEKPSPESFQSSVENRFNQLSLNR